MVSKKNQKKAILDLINKKNLRTQNDIIKALKEEKNITLSQSSVSRTLEALNAKRDDNNNYYVEEEAAKNEFKEALANVLKECNPRTYKTSFFTIEVEEGYENLLALNIEKSFSELISTFTKNGVVLVVVKQESLEEVLMEIEELISKKN